ncbi:50S ribosomal protein L11 methyltransferase [Jeotgalibaca sp. MA1X17-3]|uniref:50S ribosomal protein L11 methyltransferase n=1 Tax=Jeotgalibaca sp. MA1X17-3 TaxID=2908211 RepID=UPI002106A98C|nr:50S ribosomal protein L11 methyltransferase [Jeotgalibaca sp. MA1X17-3]
MEWNEVVIVTSTEAVDAVANLFMDAGAKGTAIEDELDFINLKDDGFGQIKEYREQPEKITTFM